MTEPTNPNAESQANLSPDHWINLARLRQESFFSRRQTEWRLNFAYWTAIISFTAAFFVEDGIRLPEGRQYPWILFGVYLAIFVISAATWQCWIQKSHARDKLFIHFYVDKARGMSTKTDPDTKLDKRNKPKVSSKDIAWHWYIAQFLVSLILLAGSWVIITQLSESRATN